MEEKQHFVVGLGASAGGLEALEAFFSNMPVDSGMSFVVIQHLAPDFKSLMDELLGRHTTMPIYKAENGMYVEPDSIYLIPPKKEMVIKDNRLLLRDRGPSGSLNLPIDLFFHSLADQVKEKAIGIIFSGTGNDGTKGITAIHEHGGMVMCQSPESASFDGMPNSTINTGLVDVIVNPNEMPDMLFEYTKHSDTFFESRFMSNPDTEHDIYSAIFGKLKDAYGVDFQFYKPSTIGRRIERRMTLHRSNTVEEYIELLANEKSNELELLYRDLLIGVTQFFRDEEIWQYCEKSIIPSICERVSNDNELRFWVPGCATGEEAYSLAILVHEWLTANGKPQNVRIFATDLHKGSLSVAGKGVYPQSALASMSEERRSRYFSQVDDDYYEVAKDIRSMVVFAYHNILKDPPFTKLDFVSCRNLLIYLLPEAQKRVLGLFHFAMRLNGVLMLGPSESLGEIKTEFEELNRRFKIYIKKRDIKLPFNFKGFSSSKSPETSGGIPLKQPMLRRGAVGGRDINLIRAYDVLLQEYVPPSLLIENNGSLAHTFGTATEYLRPPTGASSLNILDLIHPDLRTAVSTAMQRTNHEPKPISYGGLKVNISQDEVRIVRITIRPLSEYKPSDYLLINIEDTEASAPVRTAPSDDVVIHTETEAQESISSEHIRQLEQELGYTKENLQATVEELETSNEELQATNEELMASNEELQSTNEELHSVNEELYTVNREYEEKITELTQLTDDMDNLLASTDIGTIFLDANLKIRKFTPAAARQFSLLTQDIGRPITHLNRNIDFDNFETELEKVLETDMAKSFEVKNNDNHWFLMSLNPYRNDKNVTTGVVITFVQITLLIEASKEITKRNQDLQSYAYAISHDLSEPVRVMQNFSELLIEDLGKQKDEVIQSHITEIRSASSRLKQMLDGTLQFSRVMTQGERFKEASLMDCLEDAKNILKTEIKDSDTVILCDQLPPIQCDHFQISRVFKELIDNSIKYHRHGISPEIIIACEKNESECILTLSNNGHQIQEHLHDKIFQIFFSEQVNNSEKGVGIGLSVAKRIIERHNGSIVSKQANNGACFQLNLPIVQS